MNRMSSRITMFTLALTIVSGPTAASAQLSGVLGGALPDVASVGAGNAAGVLSYCVKNKLTNATNASSVLGKLTGKPGVKESSGFSLGQSGTLQTDKSTLSLGSLKGKVKSKLCDMVLDHATSLI
jgi:type IV secretory pathway TrbL component